MKHLIAGTVALLLSLPVIAEQPRTFTATSPAHRTVLLELYTSEGCSSCPPADRFLTRLKQEHISSDKLIPLAFHVTYWDYIGWQDQFGNELYDQRQRRQARLNNKNGVYTPQLMINGDDYRRYSSLYSDITRINAQSAEYALKLTAAIDSDMVTVKLDTNRQQPKSVNPAFAYIVLYEHDLQSQVDDGENKGALLHHDYVVRDLKGPYEITGQRASFDTEFAVGNYKINNCGIVAFVQPGNKADVLQSVSLEFMQKMFASEQN